MEIELKYIIHDPADIDRLFCDPEVEKAKDEKSVESIPMDAVYYDTASMALSGAGIAFRVRKEDERYVATLKWSSWREKALYRREEVNRTISDPEFQQHPTVELFEECEIGDKLKELTAGEPLVPLVEMNFVRRKARLDIGHCIMEMSVDRGDITAGNRLEPILEVEFELLTGEEEAMTAFAEDIASKYDLSAGEMSKFARGLALIGLKGDE